MNNFHLYQRYGNMNTTTKEPGPGLGGYGLASPLGSGRGGPVGHPLNGTSPSPQAAWGAGAAGGFSTQSRGGGPGGGTASGGNIGGAGGGGSFGGQSRGGIRGNMYNLSKGVKKTDVKGGDAASMVTERGGAPQPGIFDPSEFPSLGGDGRAGMHGSNGMGGYPDLYTNAAPVYNGDFRTKVSELQPSVDLHLPNDDFPALSANGTANGRSGFGATGRWYSPAGFGEGVEHRMNSMTPTPETTSSHSHSARTRTPAAEGLDVGNSRDLSSAYGGGSSGTIGEPKSGEADAYGMKGLLRVMTPNPNNSDLVLLSLGIDLTTLGLHLNSPGLLYENFRSPYGPYGERGSTKQGEPNYRIPSCYFMQPPELKTAHFSKFPLESLFYIFYSMPRDALQIYAALELYDRDWRYHKDLKLWFTRVPGTSMAYERGSYIYFDITGWERRPFREANRSFVHGFLSEEEIGSGVS